MKNTERELCGLRVGYATRESRTCTPLYPPGAWHKHRGLHELVSASVMTCLEGTLVDLQEHGKVFKSAGSYLHSNL